MLACYITASHGDSKRKRWSEFKEGCGDLKGVFHVEVDHAGSAYTFLQSE
jgi:hypothetical protein